MLGSAPWLLPLPLSLEGRNCCRRGEKLNAAVKYLKPTRTLLETQSMLGSVYLLAVFAAQL